MEKNILTPKKRERAEKVLDKWSKDEIQERTLSANNGAIPYLIDDCYEELTLTTNLLDALIDVCFMDNKKLFDGLNEAFAENMDQRAKAGLLMRGEVASEIQDFHKITNLLRLAQANKQGIFKMQNHYEKNLFDIRSLRKVKEWEDQSFRDQQSAPASDNSNETLAD